MAAGVALLWFFPVGTVFGIIARLLLRAGRQEASALALAAVARRLERARLTVYAGLGSSLLTSVGVIIQSVGALSQALEPLK